MPFQRAWGLSVGCPESRRRFRMAKARVIGLLFGLVLSVPGSAQQTTLTLLADFNQTHSLSDVVHLGDNYNDCDFIPPSPSGTSWTATFSISAAQLAASAPSISVDQYQADNLGADRSFVMVNGVVVGLLSYYPSLQSGLCNGTSVPVVTNTFSISPSILTAGVNTVQVQSGIDTVRGYPGNEYDDFDITNIRITGLTGDQCSLSQTSTSASCTCADPGTCQQ